MKQDYINSTRKQFEYYQSLGEKSFEQLNENELFWQYNEVSNSIAIIVKHLSGNMISRWTDFLNTDGEKSWRNRDDEFELTIETKSEMLQRWNNGWRCLFDALDSINENNFDTKIYIRNQEHTVVDAINRQLAHYAYHIGQIVFIARMIKNSDWKNLSIPRGASKAFNVEKFAKGKHSGHFTDDLK